MVLHPPLGKSFFPCACFGIDEARFVSGADSLAALLCWAIVPSQLFYRSRQEGLNAIEIEVKKPTYTVLERAIRPSLLVVGCEHFGNGEGRWLRPLGCRAPWPE